MAEVRTVPAKYIFLDIVGYTRNRSVEAQSEIVDVLNRLVRDAVGTQKLPDESVIYIPTGDGMCVALLNVVEPYDVHMQIALNILSSVNKHNAHAPDAMRKFEIRVGINENVDNLVEDVNGRQNVAGAGVSTAQRIMDKADAGQILIGSSVFDFLNQRERYMSKFRSYEVHIKHGQKLAVHQYVQEGLPGLNTKSPSVASRPKPKLTKLAAYYFAHAIKLRELLRSVGDAGTAYDETKVVLLWLLTHDSVQESEATDTSLPLLHIPDVKGESLEQKLSSLQSLPFYIKLEFTALVQSKLSLWVSEHFEEGGWMPLFVNAAGKEKLKNDWPDIWNAFELS